MNKRVVEFKNFNFKYYKKEILKDVNLKIEESDKVVILGENGCGKSTIIKIIGGSIIVKNKNYRNDFKNIFYLSDKFRLIKNAKVKDFLKIMKEYYKSDIDIVKYLETAEIENIKIKNLSKGNRQKLGILTSLVSNSDLILIDEVFDGVDIKKREKLIELIKESNKTFIIITHEKELFKDFRQIEIKDINNV